MSFKREYKITLLIFALLWIILPTINLIVVVFQIIVAYAIFFSYKRIKKRFQSRKKSGLTLKQTLNDMSKNLPEETTKTENKSFTQEIRENKEIIEPVTSNINTLEKDKTSEKTYLTPYMDIDSIPKEFNDLKQNKEDKSNIEYTKLLMIYLQKLNIQKEKEVNTITIHSNILQNKL